MAQTDLDLTYADGLYAFADQTTDAFERMRNRFRIQFLSTRETSNRGCTFYSELKAGRLRTNSDIVSIFSLSAAEIIIKMRQLQQDIYPNRAELNSFEFIDAKTIALTFTLYTTEGSIEDNVEVAA